MDNEQITPKPRITPDSRKIGVPQGTAIKINDDEWLLANVGLARIFNEYRNRIYQDIRLSNSVDMQDIRICAWYMLTHNYRLTEEEAGLLIATVEDDELVDTVTKNLLCHYAEDNELSYTNWARSALLANGLDPVKITATDLPLVLRQLTETGRAIRLEDFTAVDQHIQIRRALIEGT